MALPAGSYDFDNTSSAPSAATGGTIKNGMVINSSGGGIGLVKMLALTGIGLIIWRLVR